MDLRAGVVEVHSGPHADGYGAVRTYARGEVVRSATLAEVVAFGAEHTTLGDVATRTSAPTFRSILTTEPTLPMP